MEQPDQSVIDFVNEHRLAVMATQRKSGPPQLTMINYLSSTASTTLSPSAASA